MQDSDKPVLDPSQVIENMVQYLWRNVALDNKRIDGEKDISTVPLQGKNSIIISGDCPFGIHKGEPFELEAIVNLDPTWNSKTSPLLRQRLRQMRRKKMPYHAVIFPKSIDYEKAKVQFESPFFSRPDLLKTFRQIVEEADPMKRAGLQMLLNGYKRFEHDNVKDLSRLEWRYALKLGRGSIFYYNPVHQCIDMHEFQRFPYHIIIPANRKKGQGYFWEFVLSGKYPQPAYTPKAMKFAGIQEGLHDSVRRIVETDHIKGTFSLLADEKTYGAKPVQHEEPKAHYHSNLVHRSPRKPAIAKPRQMELF